MEDNLKDEFHDFTSFMGRCWNESDKKVYRFCIQTLIQIPFSSSLHFWTSLLHIFICFGNSESSPRFLIILSLREGKLENRGTARPTKNMTETLYHCNINWILAISHSSLEKRMESMRWPCIPNVSPYPNFIIPFSHFWTLSQGFCIAKFLSFHRVFGFISTRDLENV